MDGEWPLTLRQPADPEHEQYQADRGSNNDLPGGEEQHEERTKHALELLEEVQDVQTRDVQAQE